MLPELRAEKPNDGSDETSEEHECLPDEEWSEHPPVGDVDGPIQFEGPRQPKKQQGSVHNELTETKNGISNRSTEYGKHEFDITCG